MNKPLLLATVCLVSPVALQVPVRAAPKHSLPREVRALLPKGATSFLCERLPLGPRGTKMLVHIWGTTRPAPPYGYSEFRNSPFCIDIFAPILDEKKHWSWNLVNSAAYINSDGPGAVKGHWLQPSKQQGPVLEVISGSGAPGVSTGHALFVFYRGFERTYTLPTPQIFGSGGSGGGNISENFDGLDERGYMTVRAVNSFAGKTISTTVYRWNGKQFAAPDENK